MRDGLRNAAIAKHLFLSTRHRRPSRLCHPFSRQLN
jgi:hypothetical protein